MPVTVDTSGADRKIRKAFRGLSPPVRKKILKQVANSLMRNQRVRVESEGRGSDGQPMRGYSPAYREVRAEKGRATDMRTLSFTGQMHGARKLVKVTGDSANIGWPAGKNAQKAAGNQRRTPFIKATAEEVNAVISLMREMVKRAVKTGSAPKGKG